MDWHRIILWGYLLAATILAGHGPIPAIAAGPLPIHSCHLWGQGEWASSGTIEHVGLSTAYGVPMVAFRLADGCLCQVYMSMGLGEFAFVRGAHVVLSGVELGAPDTVHLLLATDAYGGASQEET